MANATAPSSKADDQKDARAEPVDQKSRRRLQRAETTLNAASAKPISV